MRRMHRVISLALGLLLVAVPMQAALAQNADQTKIIERIMTVYETSAGDLEAMRADGLGWGEIIMILELAQQPGQSISSIRLMRDQGMGFGQIARELNVDPGDLGRAVAAVMSPERSQGGQGGPPESPGAAGREHSRGRP